MVKAEITRESAERRTSMELHYKQCDLTGSVRRQSENKAPKVFKQVLSIATPVSQYIPYDAGNSAAPNCLRIMQCAGITLPDPSSSLSLSLRHYDAFVTNFTAA
ncbi:hypothetical protein EVAR_64092_1 [Eumeta japonica]|uniref:Uncharacterized protein n=1 Tax=Eumeta variegata TaxID=151549 RepID=A0A4C1ZII6_EUMVA|nr:hypothetical protein EVAR_64092_1 [Eumeta japonica]